MSRFHMLSYSKLFIYEYIGGDVNSVFCINGEGLSVEHREDQFGIQESVAYDLKITVLN